MAEKEKENKEIVVITQDDVNKAVESHPNMKWFILQTYAGKDAAAKKSIEERLITTGAQEGVGLILMAEKKVSELKNGKMKISKKKLYPGYLYILSDSLEDTGLMDEKVYSAINGAANVHGFIGQDNASLPKCIRNKVEIKRMISQLQDGDGVENSFLFEIGTEVVITEGNFDGVTGIISELDFKKNIAKVEMKILGTITPVDLGFDSIALLSNK